MIYNEMLVAATEDRAQKCTIQTINYYTCALFCVQFEISAVSVRPSFLLSVRPSAKPFRLNSQQNNKIKNNTEI